MRFLLWFGGTLVFADILVRSVRLTSAPATSAVLLASAFAVMGLLIHACVKTYRYVWQATVVNASVAVGPAVVETHASAESRPLGTDDAQVGPKPQ
jgi:hypothetical protein